MADQTIKYDVEQDNINDMVSQAMKSLENEIPEEEKQAVLDMVESSEKSVQAENFQFSFLALKILQAKEEEEAYRKEMDALLKNLADKAGINLSEGAENSPERFSVAIGGLSGFTSEDIKKAAPKTYSDIQSDFMDIEKVQARMRDIGIETPTEQDFSDLAQKVQLAECYHRNFDNQNVDYFQSLAKSVPEINDAFSTVDKKQATKFATFAVMTAATGGSNLLVKGGIFAAKKMVTNKKIQSVAKKGVGRFRGFLEKSGVNLDPFDKAMKGLESRFEKGFEKLKEHKFAFGVGAGVAVAGVAAWALIANDIDMESIKNTWETIRDAKPHGYYERMAEQAAAAAEANDGVRTTGPIQEVYDESGVVSNHETFMSETPGAPTSEHEKFMNETPSAPDSDGVRATGPFQEVFDAHGSDAGGDAVTPAFAVETVSVDSGESIYSSVKEQLTQKLGMEPSEQQVMAITSDVVAQHGIENPGLVKEGFEFSFNYEDYEYVNSVTQEQVDIARYGSDFAGSDYTPTAQTTTGPVGETKTKLMDLKGSLDTASEGFAASNEEVKRGYPRSPSEVRAFKDEFGL